MYGEPALPPGFDHLPHANPDAPKGGRLVLGEIGGFDSLNPFVLKGTAPWALRFLVFESLMGRSWDEPFTLYGLLAESVETDEARSHVAFTLRSEARFADGSPVTVEDVIWSFETLGTQGLPGYRNAWRGVRSIRATGPRSLRIDFARADRELPLIFGLWPVLRKADWAGQDFTRSGLRVPVGSGPYVVADLEPGRFISFRRNPDWWAKDLPLMRGQMNFDEIRYEFFRDSVAAFEAFRAGEIMVWREGDPTRWQTAYDFPAVRAGRVVLSEIPHHRPTGMRGFVFNTRRALFADWRVREALITAFNFPWINQRLNGGVYKRITSYFSNSPLGYAGRATPAEEALLRPYLAELPPDVLEGYRLPPGNAQGRDRAGLRRALALLEQAGWRVRDGVLRDREGRAFSFEILLRPTDSEAVASIWADSLRSLGIEARLRIIDAAQHDLRRETYDFDVIVNSWALSLSPGNEQWLYWGSEGRTTPGTRNYMGAAEPAIDAMIRAMLSARHEADFLAAVRALDRVLMAGRYVVPFWYAPRSWLAHDARLAFPARTPLYGDWIGFLPDLWWWRG
ncbi:MAG: ABC transporter substrate-binding protein [Alphaproteobacteria bacterium]|nr:MAG: ABC transporter substrate-binding protein [Alphaproteobacteria bacterium]